MHGYFDSNKKRGGLVSFWPVCCALRIYAVPHCLKYRSRYNSLRFFSQSFSLNFLFLSSFVFFSISSQWCNFVLCNIIFYSTFRYAPVTCTVSIPRLTLLFITVVLHGELLCMNRIKYYWIDRINAAHNGESDAIEIINFTLDFMHQLDVLFVSFADREFLFIHFHSTHTLIRLVLNEFRCEHRFEIRPKQSQSSIDKNSVAESEQKSNQN